MSLRWLASKARWQVAPPLLLLRGRHHDFTSDLQFQLLLSPALILRRVLSTHTLRRSPTINQTQVNVLHQQILEADEAGTLFASEREREAAYKRNMKGMLRFLVRPFTV